MTVITPSHFTPIQLVCADYIQRILRQISDEWYAAEWLMELDYEIYSNVVKGKSSYIDAQTLKNLQTCSELIGGWVAWDNIESNPKFFNHTEIKNNIQDILDKRNKS